MHAGQIETSSNVPPPPLVRVDFSSPGKGSRSIRSRSRRSVALITLAVLLSGVIVFFAARAFLHGRSRANELVSQLHTRISLRDWDGIYDDADTVYQGEMTRADSDALFAAINRKLGQVKRTSVQSLNLNVNGSGSYLSVQSETEFAGDEHATETIVWRSLGGAYHLHSYKIQSLPMLTK